MSVWDETPSASPITSARAWTAEGARVALVSCTVCGAALLLDPDDRIGVVEVHVAWHLARGERPERRG